MKLHFKNLRHTFWAHINRSTIQQKLFQNFLPQESGVFGNNIDKEPEKPSAKLKKYVYYIFKNICSACNPMQVVVFCKKYITFVVQRLKFSHFEGNIIP